MVSRVLFPALMEAGAGKQNAVEMVRRCAGRPCYSILVVFPSSILNLVKNI